jgi:hypothetical protein
LAVSVCPGVELTRAAHPAAESVTMLRKVRARNFAAGRSLRGRRISVAIGNNRKAQMIGEETVFFFSAVVLGWRW